jgi:two-component system, cell cycle sensor histidine kinase DivJ
VNGPKGRLTDKPGVLPMPAAKAEAKGDRHGSLRKTA